MNKLRVFTAFSGYDSQCMALDRCNIDYDLVGWSEIDRYAIIAHNAVYPQYKDRNYGDICKIDWNTVSDFDFFTYSFPCTDISFAGEQRGLEEGSGTRSSLLWECRKAIETKRPKYLLMENVKALVSKKFKPYFDEWCSLLEKNGYRNYWNVMNAKDYGVPQNRERVFLVSILDDKTDFLFPEKIALKKRLKDILEDNVDERYYVDASKFKKIAPILSNTAINGPIITKLNGRNTENPSDRTTGIHCEQRLEFGEGISNTLTTVQKDNYVVEPSVVQIGNIEESKGFSNPQRGRVYDIEGVSPTLDSMSGGNRQPKILSYTRDRRGKITNYHEKDLANTIHTSTGSGGNTDQYIINGYSVRKLTPTECFRLMDVSDQNIQKIQNSGVSKSQQYRMAGNSIVVSCMENIFKILFKGYIKTNISPSIITNN